MKVEELIGVDIMKAYDGNYLSKDFGYSCANFNVKNNWNIHNENEESTFDFYTKNTKNVSCFVYYNNNNKIWGRRMFFKGKSMINDDEFEVPLKMGEDVKYLYGYYGANDNEPQRAIFNAVIEKYGKGIVYTDKFVINNMKRDYDTPIYWIMEVEKTDFKKYPPIDFLKVSIELKALSNFRPKSYINRILERDFKKKVDFNDAYRYEPGVRKNYNYNTWVDHRGKL